MELQQICIVIFVSSLFITVLGLSLWAIGGVMWRLTGDVFLRNRKHKEGMEDE